MQLLELACKPPGTLSSDARKLQLAAWDLIVWCCRHRLTAASQFMQTLLSANALPRLLGEAVEAAIVAGQQQQQQQTAALPRPVKELPLSTQHAVEILTGVTARHLPNPPWLEPQLHNLVRLLAVSQSGAVVTDLLLLFQAHCTNWCGPAALQPELGSLVRTVVQRRLAGEGGECLTARIAAARLVGEAWRHGDAALRGLVAKMDMSDLAAVADATHSGMGQAYNTLLWYVQLADHPGLRDHAAGWLVSRLPATIVFEANSANYSRAMYLVQHLPMLQAVRPDLMPMLLERGLLSAMACCIMPPDSNEVVTRSMAMLGAASVLQLLGEADPAVKAAALANTAVASAFDIAGQNSGLPVRHVISEPLPIGKKPVRLGRLRVCAYEGCGKVECDNRVFKLCAACKERVGRDPLSNEEMMGYYCGKECQAADRYAGHSYCILESIVKGG